MVIDKRDFFLEKQMKSLGKQLQVALKNIQSYSQEEITGTMDRNQIVFIDSPFQFTPTEYDSIRIEE